MRILLIAVLSLLWALRCESDVINCVAAGTFRKMRDPTCRNYYTCTLLLNAYFVKTDYACPAPQKFNPTTKVCDLTSICIDSFCYNQAPLAKLADPNAVDSVCRTTYIQCQGIINQYPVIEQCAAGCC